MSVFSATFSAELIVAGVVPQSSCNFRPQAPALICSKSDSSLESFPLHRNPKFNGNSSTAFYLPEFTSISSNLTWTNGIGIPLDFIFDQKNASLKLDSALYNPFDSKKRAVTYRIALQFSFSIEGLPKFFNGG